MDINTALGMVSERPLQVDDWVVLVDPQPKGLSQLTTDLLCKLGWPRRLTGVPDRYSAFVDGCSECCDSSRFRRYDPPRDEVVELREQLATVTRERDELREDRDRVCALFGIDERDDGWLAGIEDGESSFETFKDAIDFVSAECCKDQLRLSEAREQLATVQSQLTDWMDTAEALYKAVPVAYERGQLPENGRRKPSEMVKEYLAELQAEAAAMRKLIGSYLYNQSKEWEKNTALDSITHKNGSRGWVSTLLANMHNDLNSRLAPTAGRELLDELRRKDERITELEADAKANQQNTLATAELLHHMAKDIERKRKKCHTAKSSTLRGKIDPAWFGKPVYWKHVHGNTASFRTTDGKAVEELCNAKWDCSMRTVSYLDSHSYYVRCNADGSEIVNEQLPVWQYRGHAYSGVWRTSDGKMIEYRGKGIWQRSTLYPDWQALCANTSTYPCDENGKRLEEQMTQSADPKSSLDYEKCWIHKATREQLIEVLKNNERYQERVDAQCIAEHDRQVKRVADLESQLAKHNRDAELCRELRAWIKNGVFSVVGNNVVIGCQCVPTGLAELLISIRDGGAK